jgi:hypothetical protein
VKTLEHADERAEVLRRLHALSLDSRPRWGRMSAPEMVCHLSDSFLAVLGERPVSDVSTLLNRTLVKWIALYAPLPWPPGIQTRPEVDPLAAGTRPAEFAADVARVEALVGRVIAETPGVGLRHPVFGRITRAQVLRWGYLHMDHHLRQFGA